MFIRLNSFLVERHSAEKREQGNAFLMYMLLIPVLFLVFSFGVQVAINQHSKTTLQSALDQATQSALSASVNGGKNVSVSSDLAPIIRKVYDANRFSQVFNVECGTLPAVKAKSLGKTVVKGPKSGCSWREGAVTVKKNGNILTLRYEVTDYTSNMFGAVLFGESQEYNLISEARITYSNS